MQEDQKSSNRSCVFCKEGVIRESHRLFWIPTAISFMHGYDGTREEPKSGRTAYIVVPRRYLPPTGGSAGETRKRARAIHPSHMCRFGRALPIRRFPHAQRSRLTDVSDGSALFKGRSSAWYREAFYTDDSQGGRIGDRHIDCPCISMLGTQGVGS